LMIWRVAMIKSSVSMNKAFLRKVKNGNLIFQIFVVFLGLATFGTSLRSRFSLIDDHEIISYLGLDQSMTYSEFLPALMNTEFGSWGSFLRFRPIFYAFKVTEALFFGYHPFFFHLVQLIILIASVYFFTIAIVPNSSRTIGQSLALRIPISITLVTLPAWSGIVPFLGATEILSTFGYSLILYSFRSLQTYGFNSRTWYLFHFAVILIVGSKENGVFCLLPYGLFLLIFKRQKIKISKSQMLILIATVIWAVYCFMGPFLAINNNQGMDYYGQNRSVTSSINALFASYNIWQIKIALILSIIVILQKLAYRLTEGKWTFGFTTSSTILITILMMTDYAVYGLALTNLNNRYSINIEIGLAIILIMLALSVTEKYLRNTGPKFLPLAIILLFQNQATISNISDSLERQNSVVNSSIVLNDTLERLHQLNSTAPALPIKILTTKPFDYEPVFALLQFMKFESLKNPKYLTVLESKAANEFENSLLETLIFMEKNGNANLGLLARNTKVNSSSSICIDFKASNSVIPKCAHNLKIPVIGASG